jgi:stringent starvation protein B
MTAAGDPAQLPSRRPYLLRAMHEWMGDAGFTPHLIVDTTRAGVEVPMAYVKDDKIVLNVSLSATQHLRLQNDWIEFDARFGGVVHRVHVPINAVLGIYARETGEGMVFNEAEPDSPPPPVSAVPGVAPPAKPVAGSAKRARLTVVK